MATGGIFQLITNDGKQDRMLMATSLLNTRLNKIVQKKTLMGLRNTTPTLADVEVTHIVFVNAHFKPFAAIALEYNRTNVQNGTAQFNQKIQFSIPQFGDFFSDMALHLTIGEVTSTAADLPTLALSDLRSGSDLGESSFVNHNGVPYGVNASTQNFVKYCDYPGIRILRETRFEVNGNPLDSYTASTANVYQQYGVPEDKRVAFNRLVGQENEVKGLGNLVNVNGATDKYGTLGNTENDTSRRCGCVLNGPQTPKLTQPELEMFIPLRFWFNKDPRLAIPSVSIPYGQRFLTFQLAPLSEIIQVTPGNVFAQSVFVDGNNYQSVVDPYLVSGSSLASTPNIDAVLIINNLFVNPEIHDIYIERIGFNLIRVHREHTEQLSVAASTRQLTQLKWPIETLFVCFQPTVNKDDANNENSFTEWYKCNSISKERSDCITQLAIPATVAGLTTAGGLFIRSGAPCNTLEYDVDTKTVDTLELEAYGNRLFDNFTTGFYNAYIPYTYGGPQIVAPKDSGTYMINFALYPGTYQPSGHINISRAREFNLKYTSSFISSSNVVELLITAVAINFLLISDGSANLRYST